MEIDDGQKLIEQLARDGFEVSAAGWIKAYNADWYLYVVSPVLNAEGVTNAYQRVQTAIRSMPEPFWVVPLDVKLIGPSEKLAQALLDVQRLIRGGRRSATVGPGSGICMLRRLSSIRSRRCPPGRSDVNAGVVLGVYLNA